MAEVWAGVRTPGYVRSPEELMGLSSTTGLVGATGGGKVIQASKAFTAIEWVSERWQEQNLEIK